MTVEQRSIYSGPIRRALDKVDRKMSEIDELGGVPGPPGSTGPPGPPGPPGGGGSTYVHNQGVAASTWVIVHGLNYYPNVTVEDSAGTTVEGEVVYDSTGQLTLTFSAAFGGIAYLS